MRQPKARLRWFSLQALGDEDPWSVWLVEWIDDPTSPHGLMGLTDYVRREILIAAWQSHAEIVHTLMHEMMHASAPHRDDPLHRLAEEMFIADAEKQMWAFCAQMGLSVPDLPSGFARLRERSIKRAEAK